MAIIVGSGCDLNRIVRPNLLFLSPTMPNATGHGSSIRSGIILQQLSELYNVYALIIQLYTQTRLSVTNEWLTPFCKSVQLISQQQVIEGARKGRILFDGIEAIHKVHVFHLLMAPFIKSLLMRHAGDRPVCVLDLDDYESKKLHRFAAVSEADGDSSSSLAFHRRALEFEQAERAYLCKFDQIYVSQRADCHELSNAHGLDNVSVVPNCVRLPDVKRQHGMCGIATIVFVGTLDYFPNEDGIVWFCSEILPIIRDGAGVPFRVLIVGARPTYKVLALGNIPEVTVIGEVDSLDSIYSHASMALVPLRAGGGTRLKILEAFSYECPVISTSVGAEGLDVGPGSEILIGDSPRTFAQHCITLLRDPTQIDALGSRGFEWVKHYHSVENMRECLRQLAVRDGFHGSSVFKELDVPRFFRGLTLNQLRHTIATPAGETAPQDCRNL